MLERWFGQYAVAVRVDFTLPSFAKINWTLRIVGKRDDGFHELCTVFQTVSLHDSLHFAVDKRIRLTCNTGSVPTNDKNLVVRAAKTLRKCFDGDGGAAIYLTKRIPTPGGLGGGSSNAAVALIGLRRLWNLDISDRELCEIGAQVGSDVPFFLTGGTAVGSGRGEIVEPVRDICEEALLIVTPEVAVATATAFAGLNARTLTKGAADSNLSVCREALRSLDLRHSVLINDFEPSVFARNPEIERVKKTLLDLGAVKAAMSGSGASIFGIFDNTETRQAAIKALDQESNWRKFAVATISRSEYREALRF